MGKSRRGFVTNSSSSSFIFTSSKEIPGEYKGLIDILNKFDSLDGMVKVLELMGVDSYLLWESSKLSEIMDKFKFTLEQLFFIILLKEDKEYLYDKVIEAWNSDEAVYSCHIDRDWLYKNPDLENFILDQTVIHRVEE